MEAVHLCVNYGAFSERSARERQDRVGAVASPTVFWMPFSELKSFGRRSGTSAFGKSRKAVLVENNNFGFDQSKQMRSSVIDKIRSNDSNSFEHGAIGDGRCQWCCDVI